MKRYQQKYSHDYARDKRASLGQVIPNNQEVPYQLAPMAPAIGELHNLGDGWGYGLDELPNNPAIRAIFSFCLHTTLAKSRQHADSTF